MGFWLSTRRWNYEIIAFFKPEIFSPGSPGPTNDGKSPNGSLINALP
jgi:hypothetical protein